MDENIKIRAHNIFLNALLPVGAFGLVLKLAVFGSRVVSHPQAPATPRDLPCRTRGTYRHADKEPHRRLHVAVHHADFLGAVRVIAGAVRTEVFSSTADEVI
jgi:hypothetical protein